MRRILATSALPYANGAIHLGHLLEHVQTDIWVRSQRLAGNLCTYVCADDAHGTATMLAAEAEGIAPEVLIERLREEHARDLRDFLVEHDNYHSTHSPENRALTERIYLACRARGDISSRPVRQLYDAQRGLFLADRHVHGDCPRCGAGGQHGDNCDNCGATYDATELGNPRSVLSGAVPELRESTHYFFELPNWGEWLARWVRSGAVQEEVANKLAEWLEGGLKAWDISRDAPYFGFGIPDAPGKYFYVWLDAPIGYLASFRNLCDRRPDLDFDAYWRADSTAEVHHFIGKDIVNFHCLFWPATLAAAGFRAPTRVHVHGFVTVDGAKMSKSRGTFVAARRYLDHLDPEHLRYYFAARLGPTVDDIDLNLADFVNRVNADLVGKYVNIASRCAPFLARGFGNRLGGPCADHPLFQRAAGAAGGIAALYDAGEFARALREVMAIADETNAYIAANPPWEQARDPALSAAVHATCTLAVNVFRLLTLYLKPVIPATAARAEAYLQVAPLAFADAARCLHDHALAPFTPLMQRIDAKAVARMVEAGREGDAEPAPAASAPPREASAGTRKAKATPGPAATPAAPEAAPAHVDIADFAKVDLRIARITDAATVDGADKLLRLTVDLGGETRTVFAGIRAAYAPADLVGRLTVVVANLAPRRMRFGTSEGMVLAAGPGGRDIFLLSPDAGAAPGMQVR
jgi:methionyl-tRNA synthetase